MEWNGPLLKFILRLGQILLDPFPISICHSSHSFPPSASSRSRLDQQLSLSVDKFASELERLSVRQRIRLGSRVPNFHDGQTINSVNTSSINTPIIISAPPPSCAVSLPPFAFAYQQ
jgi:hypothetical protein